MPDNLLAPRSWFQVKVSRRAKLADAILLAGGLLYAVLCFPAIGRRGYPPIDPMWMVMPWLWPFPIVISAIFDSCRFSSRWRSLLLYALATAFFNSGTMGGVIPRNVTLTGMMLLTFLIYFPLHAVGSFMFDSISQAIFRPLRVLVAEDNPTTMRTPSRLIVTAVAIAVAAAICPPVFRAWQINSDYARGQNTAGQDWANGTAHLLADSPFLSSTQSNYDVAQFFDPETGLPLRSRRSYNHYENGYADRIRALLAQHGPPSWSMKPYLIRDADLVSMIHAPGFEPIESFPYDVNENIVAFRGGSISRWGGTMSSDTKDLSIATPNVLQGMGAAREIAIYRTDTHPQVVFLRGDDCWIAAYHDSGKCLAIATREWASDATVPKD